MDQNNSANRDNRDEASPQARARRRRTDQNNRNYSCGCGKSYLSYPALYTHIRQKHSGIPPEGTSSPGNVNQNRGRPKRLDENDQEDDEKSVSFNNEPEESLEQLLIFLDSLGNLRQVKEFFIKPKKFETEQEKQTYLLINFPTQFFTNANDYQQILNFIKEITTERVENTDHDPMTIEEVDKDKNIKKTLITKIFAYFLIAIGPKLNEDAYKEMATFVVLFQLALNSLGYKALAAYLQEQGEQKKEQIKVEQNGDYCEEQNGEHILLIANEFILQFLPAQFPKLGTVEKTFKIFGSSDEKLKNAVYVIQNLSYWLYAMKFTNSRLALFTDEEQ